MEVEFAPEGAYVLSGDSLYRISLTDIQPQFGEPLHTLGDADPQARFRGIIDIAADGAGNLYYAVTSYENLRNYDGSLPETKADMFFHRTLTVVRLNADGSREELFSMKRHTSLDGFEYTDALYIGTNGKVWRWDGSPAIAAECPQAEYMPTDSFSANSEFLLTPDGVLTEYHGPFASLDIGTYP